VPQSAGSQAWASDQVKLAWSSPAQDESDLAQKNKNKKIEAQLG